MGNLGSNIAYFRGQLKMTQKNLGEKLYVSEKTVSHWENERSEPSSEQISSMAQLFGVRLETLHSKLNRSLALAEQKALETYNALSTQRQDDVWFGYGGKAVDALEDAANDLAGAWGGDIGDAIKFLKCSFLEDYDSLPCEENAEDFDEETNRKLDDAERKLSEYRASKKASDFAYEAGMTEKEAGHYLFIVLRDRVA